MTEREHYRLGAGHDVNDGSWAIMYRGKPLADALHGEFVKVASVAMDGDQVASVTAVTSNGGEYADEWFYGDVEVYRRGDAGYTLADAKSGDAR